MSARFLVLFLAVVGAAFSGGRGAGHEFDDTAKAIERHYGTRRTHIPLMGVANLVTKVARPAGTSGFKLAIFEDLRDVQDLQDVQHDDRRNADGPADLDQFMSGLSIGGMNTVVRAHSRRGESATYIYAGDVGKTTRLLIATFEGGSEPNRATLIEVSVSLRILMQLLQSPDHAAKVFGQ
jgi:hypothetical protein